MIYRFYMTMAVILLSLSRVCGETGWTVSKPVLSHGPVGTFDETAVKDPSVVYFDGYWHLFYTARDFQTYTTGYVCAETLDELKNARRYGLDMIRGAERYGCAPQVFYFTPQKVWYMIFQTKDSNYQPAYSTTADISDPESWSKPQPLVVKDTERKWIDFWVICDRGRAYLYYTEGHNGVMVRSTPVESFPAGWSDSRTIYTNIHEAVHIYKVKGSREFHMVYELNQGNVRSFGLAKASDPAGPWVRVTDSYAAGDQLDFEGKEPWTEMVSHGEVLRSGYDERMEYDPGKCRWLIQGILKKDKNGAYSSLPWQLGVISFRKDKQ